ncbi:MAG: tetratricopeptide repeat protein [Myxococcota bacterium]|nr:hypothetical protein [Spirochaeta sp.]
MDGGAQTRNPRSVRGLSSWRYVLFWILLALGLVFLQAGCQTPAPPPAPVKPYKASDFLDQGDPARKASMRLVVQGLESDDRAAYPAARASYERAIQVDATNPWAYLVLARYYVQQGDVSRVNSLLDQSAALFEAQGLREPRVGVHLLGLRGSAFVLEGRSADATLYLERAQELAPGVWGDDQLEADELL